MNLFLCGLQWGDEGKGKIIDLLSIFFNLNIRINGGHNAGHIIYINNCKKIIRILPSGIFKKYCLCIISNNVLICFKSFFLELNNFFSLKKILISKNCKINFFINELLDYILDIFLKINSTFSGIIPTYLQKNLKIILKLKDYYKIIFINKLKKNFFLYNLIFKYFNFFFKIILSKIIKKNIFFIKKIKKNLINNFLFVNNKNNKIFETSQGSLLDFNFGTFPFVTSSNVLSKSLSINSSYFLNKVKFIGIFKCYLTRVGNGFISKFKNKKNLLFSYFSKEIGTITNRIRKVGWIDLFLLIKTIKINNISNLIITKLDILIFFKFLKILINYYINKNILYNLEINIYKKKFLFLKSWNKIYNKYYLNNINFHKYIRLIEKITNTPIIIISIGKKETDIIIL